MFKGRYNYEQGKKCSFVLHTDWKTFLDSYLMWWNKTPFVVFGNMWSQSQRCTRGWWICQSLSAVKDSFLKWCITGHVVDQYREYS